MALYRPGRVPVTSFKIEEGYLTFFDENAMAGKLRSEGTALGTYLFYNGLTLTVSHQEHPPEQGWGQVYNNLRAPRVVTSDLAVQALYTQESDAGWISPGGPRLRVYIDYLDPTVQAPLSADTLNANKDLVQTIVVHECMITARRIATSDDQAVTYTLQFSGGDVDFVPNTTMDID